VWHAGIDRRCCSTLAHWVGFAAFELAPLHERLVANLKGSSKLFADETRCPVLDPGRGKTKTGYLWAIARDDRPWGGADPPVVAYLPPGRGAEHAVRHLAGFCGLLQVDGYAGYDKLTDLRRAGGPLKLALCWSHYDHRSPRRSATACIGGAASVASSTDGRIALCSSTRSRERERIPDWGRHDRGREAGSRPDHRDLEGLVSTDIGRNHQEG
jgi:transposase